MRSNDIEWIVSQDPRSRHWQLAIRDRNAQPPSPHAIATIDLDFGDHDHALGWAAEYLAELGMTVTGWDGPHVGMGGFIAYTALWKTTTTPTRNPTE